MASQRPQRAKRPVIFHDDKYIYNNPPPAKKAKKATKNSLQTLETKPISGSIPEQIKAAIHGPQPQYSPPISIENRSFQVLWRERKPITLFSKFFGGQRSFGVVVAATNKYAEREFSTEKTSRPWTPLCERELFCWLGLLFYMSAHSEPSRPEYWDPSIHHLGRWMTKTRFEQILRAITVNAGPQQPGQAWFYKVEPVATYIREACRRATTPASHIAVDEAMVAFTGRSVHTTTIKNKPIPEGYKVWVLASRGGVIHDWLWSSGRDGTEGINKHERAFPRRPLSLKPIKLSPTQQVPLVLCRELRVRSPEPKYVVFLDNLFSAVKLANTLAFYNIGCMGIAKKATEDLPTLLKEAKEVNRVLEYGGTFAEIKDGVLCFVW